MENYFDIAAHMYYLLRNNFGDAEIMCKARIFFDEIMSAQYEEPEQYLADYICQNQRTIADLSSNVVDLQHLRCYFTILYALDLVCERRMADADIFSLDQPLNQRYLDETEIYYTYPSKLGRKGNANDECTILFPHMLFFVKKDFWGKCEIKNYYIDFPDREFRIGFVPYPSDGVIDIRETEGKVFADEREETSADEIFYERFEYAVIEQRCDIVFGPEMCGSPALDKKLDCLCGEDGCRLLICPSYHCVENEVRRNRMRVYAWTDGHLSKTYYIKNFPARMNQVTEWIQGPSKYKIFVFHIKDFGRIGLFLCRDYLANEMRDIVSKLDFDLILVPCYTPKTSDFLSAMIADGKKRTILLGNACNCLRDETELKPVQYLVHNKSHHNLGPNYKLGGKVCDRVGCKDGNCVRIWQVKDGKASMITRTRARRSRKIEN